MLTNLPVLIILLFSFCIKTTICSGPLCTRIDRKFTLEKVPVVYRVLVTYLAKCSAGEQCVKRRYDTKLNFKMIRKEHSETIKECCSGYTQTQAEESESIKCEPICVPACTNGFCSKPSTCTCNPGYQADPDEYHICNPVCLESCGYGVCKAPNSCKCNFGYHFINKTCSPICLEPCFNGTCIAPGTCECNYGYRKTDENICEPYCSSGCTNGHCVRPDKCECDVGFENETESICKPICETPCGNGTCVAPNQCKCFTGYKVNNVTSNDAIQLDENVCVPECKNCSGDCKKTIKCDCEPLLELKHLGVEGKTCNCCSIGEKLSSTPRSTSYTDQDTDSSQTTTESSNDYGLLHDYEDDEYYTDYDDVGKINPQMTETKGINPTKNSNFVHKHDDNGDKNNHGQNDFVHNSPSVIWLYTVLSVIVLAILLLLLTLVIFRKKVFNYFIGAQYPIEELESNRMSQVQQAAVTEATDQ